MKVIYADVGNGSQYRVEVPDSLQDSVGSVKRSGKTKIIFETIGDVKTVYMFIKPAATAGDGARNEVVTGKDVACWEIGSRMMDFLNKNGIPTAYISSPAPCFMEVQKLDMYPIEYIGRKITAGSITRKYPIKEGIILETPLVQCDFKDDKYHDPTIFNDDLLDILHLSGVKNLPTFEQHNEMKEITGTACQKFYDFFKSKNITFKDFKIEGGCDVLSESVVGDYISPDEMRLVKDGVSMDKDPFRGGESVEETARRYANTTLIFREIMPEYGNFECDLPMIEPLKI